jgi:hypothetical protein
VVVVTHSHSVQRNRFTLNLRWWWRQRIAVVVELVVVRKQTVILAKIPHRDGFDVFTVAFGPTFKTIWFHHQMRPFQNHAMF